MTTYQKTIAVELSLAEWDVLALYIQIGAEDEMQGPPLLGPAIPCRESYLALLDSFEAVYLTGKNPGSKTRLVLSPQPRA